MDTRLGDGVIGYLWLSDDRPIELAAIKVLPAKNYDVCEFYIVPSCHQCHEGQTFAHHIWRRHPGHWVIKQIQGAGYASQFWQKAIHQFGVTPHADTFNDPYWSEVTRQQFTC